MPNTFRLTAAAGFAALAVVACNDGGTAPLSDQAQVLAAEQDQLGAMVDTSFGTAGAALSADPAGATATTADTAPTFWGRLRVVPGGPRAPKRRFARGGPGPARAPERPEPPPGVPGGRRGKVGDRRDEHDRRWVHAAQLRVPARASRGRARHQLAPGADGRQRRRDVPALMDRAPYRCRSVRRGRARCRHAPARHRRQLPGE